MHIVKVRGVKRVCVEFVERQKNRDNTGSNIWGIMLLCRRLFNRHFLPENVVQFRAIKDIYILSIVINSI